MCICEYAPKHKIEKFWLRNIWCSIYSPRNNHQFLSDQSFEIKKIKTTWGIGMVNSKNLSCDKKGKHG